MKNQIAFLLTILGMTLTLASCSSEDMNPNEMDSNVFHVDVNLPINEIRTRGYGDGKTVNNLKCYVYQAGAEQPIRTENVNMTQSNGKKGGSLAIDLPSGGVYDFVFLATSCPQDDQVSKLYYNTKERTINLNYAKIEGNDESIDCFFGVLPSISIDKGQSHSVTLKRPYAQLNIGTKDLQEYNKLASSSLRTVGVSVDKVYSSMNVMDGSMKGNPVKASFSPATLPSGQTFPSNEASYLSMNYLLAGTRQNVNVTMTATNSTSSFDVDFTDIPVQRNYQTNIYGNLLTKENDFKVEINPAFDSENKKDMDDPLSEYDLVLKLINTSTSAQNIKLNVRFADKSSKTINLNNYIDSNNTIKLRWEDLGINEATYISFAGTSRNPNTIKEFLKCDIDKLHITSLYQLLSYSTYLENIEATKYWDTTNIVNMGNLFQGCYILQDIDISNFNTSNVKTMSYMFAECKNIKSLDLSSFDTSNVTTMSYMFDECESLTSLDLSGFDTSNVTYMSNMFCNCYSLYSLNLSSFDTANVKTMYSMFSNCQKLSSLDLSSFDTSNVTSMEWMFRTCSDLRSVNLSSFDTSNVTSMARMFQECESLTSLDLSGFDTSNVTDMGDMFQGCVKLTSLDISSFDTSKVKYMSNMFCNCYSLYSLNLSSFDTSNVTDMGDMFQGCVKLTSLDISSFDTSNVTDMGDMFQGCEKLTYLDLSNFNTSKVTDMNTMFASCSNLEHLDLSSFDTSKVTSMMNMFKYCKNIKSLDLSSFNTSGVTNMEEMFYHCENLKSLNLSNFDTHNVTTMDWMFAMCDNLEHLDLSSFNTSKVTSMMNMFKFCYTIMVLDLSSFDMSNVTNTTGMFEGCDAEIIW